MTKFWPRPKAFADKINATQTFLSCFDREENIIGKEENAGYQLFLLFLHCFQRNRHQVHKNQGLLGKGLKITRYLYGNCYEVKKVLSVNSIPHNPHF